MTRPPAPPPSRLEELFDRALAIPPAGRDAWIAAACGGDETLRRELESLVAAAASAPAFLERPAADVELEGARAGPWRIESLLASGGMGDVYRATRAEADLPWRVAVKVLKRGLDGAAFVRRFRAERRTLAALAQPAHPSIVALIDAGTLEDGRPFLAMELVEGRAIDRFCAEERLPLRARLRLLAAVCAAVEHAHRRLVVHCDLKPGNVLVTSEGLPKVLDFGIARLLAVADERDARGAGEEPAARRPWTPGYASPELVAGRAIGCASDVFSLGVLVREVCGGDSVRRAELRAIVAKATAAEPERRYGSAAALGADLEALADGRPVAAWGGGALYCVSKLVRRHRVATAALAVAVVSLAYGGTVAWRDFLRAREEARLGWRAHTQALVVSRFLEALVRDTSGRTPEELGLALDRAAARLQDGPGLEPEAEGRVRLALGALYLEAGRREQARPHLERAHALATTSRGFGRADVERVQTLLERASADAAR